MTRWADLLEQLPTLHAGDGADRKVQTDWLCVLLARTGVEDGEPFERTVYVMEKRYDGLWYDIGYFDGDEEDPHPTALLGDAYRATVELATKHIEEAES